MAGDKQPKVYKYAPPFSVRLTLAERARLDAEAGPQPLGDYVRTRLFDTPTPASGSIAVRFRTPRP